MSSITNKEMLLTMSIALEKLTESNKKIAKDQLQMSCSFSDYVNKTDLKFKEVLGYLESNSKTNQKGVVEQVQLNTSDIGDIKTGLKVNHAKKTLIGVALGAILTFLAKVLF
mgnify:FL=1|tara:strand:- start:141 stop:476 length:336 start_codon:yes stop_codon:yes gene_type:complete